MGRPWVSNGSHAGLPWVADGLMFLPILLPHGSPMGKLWAHSTNLWVIHGSPMGLEYWPVGHPWITHGSPIHGRIVLATWASHLDVSRVRSAGRHPHR